MRSRLPLLALSLAVPASAQSFNVDVGLDFGAPSSTYAGAAGQAGTWSLVDGDDASTNLVDLTGTTTGVTLNVVPGTGSAGDWSYDNSSTTGDHQALLDDFHDVGPEVWDAVAQMTIEGLNPGTYDLYTYAWAPDDASFRTLIDVQGSVDAAQAVGGAWNGGHGEGVTYAKHRVTTTGTITVTATSWLDGSYGSVNGFQLVDLSGAPLGTNFCGPAALNSSGQGGVIAAYGSDVASENFLELTASQLPANQFGYFINSTAQGFVQPPGSQGFLCLSGSIGRHTSQIGSSGNLGQMTIPIDLTSLPRPGGAYAVQAGETWNWQLWFRDVNPTQTSNFTDGVMVTFQ